MPERLLDSRYHIIINDDSGGLGLVWTSTTEDIVVFDLGGGTFDVCP
jgi:hypothetical protein